MDYLATLLIIIAAAALALFLWGLSILRAYHDLRRRPLPRSEKLYWLIVVIVLPLAGYAAYRVGRLLTRALIPPTAPSLSSPVRGRTQRVFLEAHIATTTASEAQTTALRQQRGRKPGWRVMVAGGPCVGEEFFISTLPALIGRGPSADIPLDMDMSVSRRHAELYGQHGALYVRDLGSQHGITVNGESATTQELRSGDLIGAGASMLVLHAVQGVKER